MTSLTGSTEETLEGTVKPAPFWLVMTGACTQLGVLFYVWREGASASGGGSSDDAWTLCVKGTLGLATATWLLSVARGSPHGGSDPSLVDRLWSILPAIYCWVMAWYDAGRSSRLLIMTGLATAWAARLTYNFYIKGGYSSHGEDYRWKAVRSWFPGWQFELFNLVFICFFQLLLILAFTAPAAAALQSTVPLGALDAVATAAYAALLVGEAVADAQMFAFQTEKYRRKDAGEPAGEYARGFIETGLWGLSRHPNYFCEIHIWWAFYLFSVAATGNALNWTIWGVVFLTLLFVPPGGSVDVTESLSSRKYPCYAEYQARVSRLVPWFPAAADKKEEKKQKKQKKKE